MILRPRSFSKTVTASGTREKLTTNTTKVAMLTIQAKVANAGDIYVGGSDVSSTNCIAILDARESVSLDATQYGMANAMWDMTNIWLDTSNSGDGVVVGYADRAENE